MKKFIDILKEDIKKQKLYIIQVVGNFHSTKLGKYADGGLSSIYVLSDSPAAAKKLAEKNTKVITKMFQNFKFDNGHDALEKGDKTPVAVWKTGQAEESDIVRDDYVLTSKNKFEKIDLKKL